MTSLNHVSDDWSGLWDGDNPKSVYSRVSKRMQDAMDAIPDRLRRKSEEELFKLAGEPEQFRDCRHRFWDYFAASETAQIVMSHVFNKTNWLYYGVIENPARLMWFLQPPQDFAYGQRTILERTMGMVRNVLDDNNLWIVKTKISKDKSGAETTETSRELNTKALDQIRKLMEDMTDRVQGTSVQRVAHLHAGPSDRISQLDSVDAILQAADEEIQPPMLQKGEVVEVEDYLKVDPVEPVEPTHELSEFMEDD